MDLIPGCSYEPSQVLPHRGDMCLIDSIDEYGSDWIKAGVEVAGRGLFGSGDGTVAAWLGIEYMAQTVAAYAGMEQLQAGKPIGVGMLIGARRYEASVATFAEGWRLSVMARLQWRDGDQLGVFECVLARDGEVLATADVKVYRPDDLEEFMRTRR